MSFNELKISNLFSEDYDDNADFSRTELEVEDEFTVCQIFTLTMYLTRSKEFF